MIPVTRPFLPPKEDFEKYISRIWQSQWLTNMGPLSNELEDRLKDYLGVENLLFVTSGTMALQMAIKALELKGEIITTPFSYVATTSSIVWEGCKPVFVDIEPDTLNINPALIKDAITKKTSAILAAHVFGNPCDIEEIGKIASAHNLKVIYDAAHCFGAAYKGKSVYNYGDISTASFHATKLFHTVEGGAVITKDAELAERISKMRNFGHAGFGNFEGLGINGKNCEFHAAMGLVNLKYITEILDKRKEQCALYEELFSDLPIQTIQLQDNTEWNYSYFPAIFESEETALQIKAALEKNNIYPRRYFYPSLNKLDYVQGGCTPISDDISKRILCLPLFHELKSKYQERIADIISQFYFSAKLA
jgi:dTDP-4-amino-4,6-dideoxygalactose transaminase